MSGDSRPEYNVVFVLGGPGAGKGTQCERIQEVSDYTVWLVALSSEICGTKQ